MVRENPMKIWMMLGVPPMTWETSISIFGGVLKSGYPQIIHFGRNFPYKPAMFGVPIYGKPYFMGLGECQKLGLGPQLAPRASVTSTGPGRAPERSLRRVTEFRSVKPRFSKFVYEIGRNNTKHCYIMVGNKPCIHTKHN